MGSEEDPRKWYYEEQRKIQLLRERESKSSGARETTPVVPIWVMVLLGSGIAVVAAGYWLIHSGLAGKAAKVLRVLLR